MKILFFLTLFLFAAGIYSQVNLKMETIFTLNDEKTAKKEYLFKYPTNLITDSDCNFYVSEYMGTEIRKFSKEGKYIKTISRNGEGPGELKCVKQLFIVNNEIVVLDPILGRISYFGKDGNYLRCITRKPEFFNLDGLQEAAGNSIMALARVSIDEPKHGNKLVVYDNNFENLLTSFGHTTIFWKFDNVFEFTMDIANYLKFAKTEDKVFVTKTYYDGKVYLFDKTKNWGVKIIEGKKINRPGYEVAEEKTGSASLPKGDRWWMIFGEKWKGKERGFTVYYNYRSVGIITYKSKYIINFFLSWMSNDRYEFGADVFNLEGNYLGYSKIETGTKNGMPQYVFKPDKEDNLFLVESRSAIKKIKLTIN